MRGLSAAYATQQLPDAKVASEQRRGAADVPEVQLQKKNAYSEAILKSLAKAFISFELLSHFVTLQSQTSMGFNLIEAKQQAMAFTHKNLESVAYICIQPHLL